LAASLVCQFGCRESSEKARLLLDGAWARAKSGDLKAALKSADTGLAKFPDRGSDWHWRFLALKSEILMRQGQSEQSLALLNDALPPKFDHSDFAVWLKLTRGSALTYSERYSEAEASLLDAKSLASSSQPQLVGETLLRLGTLASLRWNLENAQSLYRDCLQFARSHHDLFLEASALGSLGLIAARMERYDESIDWNTQALELDRSQGWLSLATKAEGNIGWSYYLIGDFESALLQYRLAIQDAIRASQARDHAIWLSASGDVYYDMHDFSAAEAKSKEALMLADSLHDEDDAIYCLQNLALIALARGQFDAARITIEDSLRRLAAAPDHSQELYSRLISANLAAKTGDLAKAEDSYSQIVEDPVSPTSVRWEAQAGMAQTRALQGKVRLAERDFQLAISTISAAQHSVQREEFRLSFLSSAIQFYDRYVNFLLKQNRPLDALKIADLSRAQTLEHGLSSQEIAGNQAAVRTPQLVPQDTARRLNATLLFYWLGQDRSYLWIVTPSAVSCFPLPAAPEIDAAVKSYRQSFLDPRDPLESRNVFGAKLYDLLVSPAAKLIPKNSRVVILPDGSLTGLNFETLIAVTPLPHYWIEDVTVTVGNSLALLARSKRIPPPLSPQLLLFGDALPANKEFPPLADAKQEVEALEKHFPEGRRRIFTGGQAIASNYRSSEPASYSFLHFATHGTASTSRPLESAIILSPEENRSFKLYARDIVGQQLNAYLVSISACSGSGERVLAGEGLVGLSWAFLRAGAHNVVAGLWEVSTATAPQIMDDLYKGVTAGQDPATALRNAKLNLVHSKGPYRRPFYWAPFQLYSGS